METSVPGGYAGQILRVDLTNERIWTQPLSPQDYRQYLGGVGIGAKILYEEVPPDVPWESPDSGHWAARRLAGMGHRWADRGNSWCHD